MKSSPMDWLSLFTLFDALVLLIFIAFLVRGILTGFIRQIAFIIAMFAAFIIAGRFEKSFFDLILPYIDSPQLAFIATYIVLFIAIYYATILLGYLLKKVVDIDLMEWFDKVTGALLGIVKGFFVSTLIFMALTSIMSGSNTLLKKSFSYPFFAESSRFLLRVLKDNNLRNRFIATEPAVKYVPPLDDMKKSEKNETPSIPVKKNLANPKQPRKAFSYRLTHLFSLPYQRASRCGSTPARYAITIA